MFTMCSGVHIYGIRSVISNPDSMRILDGMHGGALIYSLNRIRLKASPGNWSC